MILNLSFDPRGVATSTVSPFFRPMIAFPTGDSFESLRSTGFASAEPTMKYSVGLLRVDVPQAHDRAHGDDARVDLLRVDHPGVREPLVELRDAMLEHHLLVLRVVVLGVLGDLAECARRGDALGDLPPLLRPQPVELALQLLVALGSEDHILQEMPSETRRRGPAGPVKRPGMVAAPLERSVNSAVYDPSQSR